MSADREWLDSLVVGSPVAVCGGGVYQGSVSIRAVEKIHKLHFVVGGSKFSRRDGWAAGRDTWSRSYLDRPDAKGVVDGLASQRRAILRRSLETLAKNCKDESRLQAAVDALTVKP